MAKKKGNNKSKAGINKGKKVSVSANEVKLSVPVGLKILCVLSFLGFIYCLVRDTGDYFAYSNFEEIKESADQTAFEKLETRFADFEKNDIDTSESGRNRLAILAIYRTIFDILAMVGTALMYFRIKKGFYLYGAAQLLYVIIPFIMFGIGAMVIYDKLALVPPLIYLILFTTQFKYLDR